jgi:peptide/nickel transport system substrate-binding protein
MRKLMGLSGLALICALGIAVAGCGSSSSNKGSSNGSSGKKGGEVTLLDSAGSIDSLDPGYWYYQSDYTEIAQPTQRWLYSWKPDQTVPTPDLATDVPKVTNGGKTLTVTIKSGIKYSPPLQNRTVAAADIKYALERCFLPAVGNGYANTYYSQITGAADFAAGKAKEIKGIQAPNATTLVFKLDKPQGVLANANALALPCTIPVPKDYAQKFDKGKQSTYGMHQVFTGPYMIQGAGSGTVTSAGYEPSKKLVLVRNPSWDKTTDFKPAYFDKITVDNGTDVTVASRKILSGQSLMSGDYAAPPTAILKQALVSNKDQLNIAPSQGNRFVAMDSRMKPFDNINVRKAVIAATDRTALRQTRGGDTLGPLATHFIPPGMPGFDEAGGAAGGGDDFYKSPTANIPLAQSYMKKAGYPTGMYTGGQVLMIADNMPPASNTATAFEAQMAKIGIKVNLRQLPHSIANSKFCSVPKSGYAMCPNLGWGKDFYDSQSMIDPIFNGKNLIPSGNTNYAQFNDPKINAAIEKAKTLTDPAARAKAWGAIDKTTTSLALLDVWLWDNQVNFASKNVNGVKSKFNSSWDLNFSSLK